MVLQAREPCVHCVDFIFSLFPFLPKILQKKQIWELKYTDTSLNASYPYGDETELPNKAGVAIHFPYY